jgi:hypothetical protein
MKLTKEQWQAIFSVLLSAVLGVLAVLGWVIEPAPIEVPEIVIPEIVMPEIVIPEPVVVMAPATEGGDIPVDLGNISFGATNFDSISVEDVTASDDVTVGDDLTVTDDASVTGDLTAGSATVSGLTLISFANLTVTNGSTLTPTYNIYALDSAGAVTMTLAASATEGQLLILIGDDANDITVADTNLRSNDGAAQVLNQYDVLMLVYQDSEWVEISESNDS